MAGLTRLCFARYGQRDSGHADLDHHLHNHYPAYGAVRTVFDQLDLHNELHYPVRIVHNVTKPGSRLISHRMLIVLAFASLVSWIVRYRFLNMYARLPPEPQRKEPQIDLFPDTQDGDSKPGLANYLDEFLSAIKVFGYRE